MRGDIIVIAAAAIALAAAGCGDEHPGRDSTPNYSTDSAGVPGSVSDPTRTESSRSEELDRNGASVARPSDTALPEGGTMSRDTTRFDSAGTH